MSPYPIEDIIREVEEIIVFVEAQEKDKIELIQQVQAHYRESARNLVHYLALRSFDLRNLQEKLAQLGISAIAHSEAYTLSNLYNILKLLYLLDGRDISELKKRADNRTGYFESKKALENHTNALFGLQPHHRTRIMVTMPSEAANDPSIPRDLLQAGMNIARLNTSHDRSADWKRMVDNIQEAESDTGKKCLIYMDLSGPKLRTQVLDPPLTREEMINPKKKKY